MDIGSKPLINLRRFEKVNITGLDLSSILIHTPIIFSDAPAVSFTRVKVSEAQIFNPAFYFFNLKALRISELFFEKNEMALETSFLKTEFTSEIGVFMINQTKFEGCKFPG